MDAAVFIVVSGPQAEVHHIAERGSMLTGPSGKQTTPVSMMV